MDGSKIILLPNVETGLLVNALFIVILIIHYLDLKTNEGMQKTRVYIKIESTTSCLYNYSERRRRIARLLLSIILSTLQTCFNWYDLDHVSSNESKP